VRSRVTARAVLVTDRRARAWSRGGLQSRLHAVL